MDLEKIKSVVNSEELSPQIKQKLILQILADDKKIIPYMLEMLSYEREQNKELILDTNAELSRALLVLDDANLKYNKKVIADPKWVAGEIKAYYTKWKDRVRCNFLVDGIS